MLPKAGPIFALAPLLALGGNLRAQEKNCAEIEISAQMARAHSLESLQRLKKKAAEGYRAQAVFATRQFELFPTDKEAAALLLSLIPRNGEQQAVWADMDNFVCEGQTDREVSSLAKLKYRLAHDLAVAVLLAPEQMQVYVWYAAEAVTDPDNDYAVQMRRVCLDLHTAFVKAVDQLGTESHYDEDFATASSSWFRIHILNPEGCRVRAFPEAD